MYVQVRHDRDFLKSLRIGDVLGDGSSRYQFFYSLFILEEHSKIVGHVLYAPLISSKPEIVTVQRLLPETTRYAFPVSIGEPNKFGQRGLGTPGAEISSYP